MITSLRRRGGALMLAGLGTLWTLPAWADTVRSLSLASNDLVYDAKTNAIYASVRGSAGERGNTITRIDPLAGTIGASIFVGSEPGKLARSGNGEYLYVALNGAGAVRRFDLGSQTAGLQFGLGSDSFSGTFFAEDIEVLPGSAGSVAISLRNKNFSPRHEGVAIFDEGVKRPTQTPGHTGSNVIEFGGSASTLYGYNNETSEFGLRKMAVDAGGVTVASVKQNIISGYNVDIRYDNGLLYTTTGAIVDPEAGTLLGTFPDIGFNGNVRPDSARNRVFFVTGRGSSLTLRAYDSRTFTLVGSLPISGAKGEASSLVRWGSDGLAFRTSETFSTEGQIFLVQSALVGAPATPSTLSLSIEPATFAESAGASAARGTVTRSGDTSQPLTVELRSSNGAEAGVPTSIVIPAGAASASFAIAAIDDALADGSQAVSISATAAGLVGASAQVTVTDNEAPALSLALSPSTWSEAAGANASVGTVSRNTSDAGELVVMLSSSAPNLASVPQVVVIPAGQRSATFRVTAIDDAIANGSRTATITASAQGLSGASVVATVTDNDAALPALALSFSSSVVDENAASILNRAPTRGRVSRAQAAATALAVRLLSSDATELRVPTTVLIPAGQAFAEFALLPVDDLVADGAQAVTITASAGGQASRSATVTVRDNEVAALSVQILPARIAENGFATVIVRRNTEISASTTALQVVLSASPAGQISLPTSVTIPARAASVAFGVSAVNDTVADGPRTVTITARAAGLVAGTTSLVVLDNEAASILSLSGRVLASPGGLPVAGVTLTLRSGGVVLDTAITSASGAYTFRGLPRGAYQITATKPGATFTPLARSVSLSASLGGQDLVATLRAQISGVVHRRGADGGLLALPNVTVTARSGGLSFSARTNSAGAFLFDRLPLGVYTVALAPLGSAVTPPSRVVRLDTSSPLAGDLVFSLAPAWGAQRALPPELSVKAS